MSIYATIQFYMKDGFKEPIMHDSVQGKFRDAALDIVNIRRQNTNLPDSQKTCISGKKLVELAKIYRLHAQNQEITYSALDESGQVMDYVCTPANYKEAQHFNRNDIRSYCVRERDNAFLPPYHQFENWTFLPSYDEYEDWADWAYPDKDIKSVSEQFDIFERYIELLMADKLFFGVQISKIKSVVITLS